MKALDDLLWLKARLEDERDFAIHAHPTFATGPEAAKRILARIQPAIDDLHMMQATRQVLHHCACYIRKHGGIYPVHLQEEIMAALGDFEMEKSCKHPSP